MQSRLETLNPELAEQLNSSAFSEASDKVMSILTERLAMLPAKAAQLLPKNFEIQAYNVSQNQIDALDDCYFTADEAGNAEDASASFVAARLLSAVRAWQVAESKFELCEAAYEAHFAHG